MTPNAPTAADPEVDEEVDEETETAPGQESSPRAASVDEDEAKDEEELDEDFPEKPDSGYLVRMDHATERIVAWTAISAYHGKENGNVKERDKNNALGTRNAVLYGCDIDRAQGSIMFSRGWMCFPSGTEINHLLKCFEWQLSDSGPGIDLESMVIADEIIDDLQVISARALADAPPKPKKSKRGAKAAG